MTLDAKNMFVSFVLRPSVGRIIYSRMFAKCMCQKCRNRCLLAPTKCPSCHQPKCKCQTIPCHLKCLKHLNLWTPGTSRRSLVTYSNEISSGTSHTHGGSKGFRPQCSVCGKHFFDSSTLKRHMEIHVFGEKNYCCNICGTEFSWKTNLFTHLKVSHACFNNFERFFCRKR